MRRIAVAVLVVVVGIGQILAAPHARSLTGRHGLHASATTRLALHDDTPTAHADAIPASPFELSTARSIAIVPAPVLRVSPSALPILSFAPKHSPPRQT
jgi:hypothetical protein